MKTAFCLLLALCVLPACQSSTPTSVDPVQVDSTKPIDPMDTIRAYRIDGKPFDSAPDINAAANAALEKKLSFNMDNATLDTIIRFVRDAAGVNLVVNWQALELVGIDRDSLMPLELKGVSAHTMLGLALEHVSSDVYKDEKAALAVRDGIVKISTKHELRQQNLETLIYDVSWFVDPRRNIPIQLYDRDDPKRTGWLRGRIKETGQQITVDANKLADWHFFCAHCDGNTSKDGTITYESYSRQELIDQLIESIQMTVGHPDEWLDNDSTIYDMSERLTVTTSPENHKAILELLKMHRRLQVEAFEQQAKTIAITLALREAEHHRLKREHQKALEDIDHALRIDPNHAEAGILRRLVVQAMAG
ncbi:MAG: hypothetical protein KTR15_10380 [Phycisphaeraceae bacterium]|nr:hypothetical protein [Phycisphaeraceae bacterium]